VVMRPPIGWIRSQHPEGRQARRPAN
jgi:hypothetical protein